ncbi:hypothetical protein [Myroides odoratus]|uniref:hypothetical protein n=1 Tax=Myroides odoratus TaxID=256 RepID=UPI0039AF5B0B
MKRILPHLFFVFFLLILGGAKVLGIPANYEKPEVQVAGIEVVHTMKELGILQIKHNQEYNKDYAFSSIETDNGDSSFQEKPDSLVLVSTLIKVFFYAISLHFILFAIKRRRTTYEALIQLFDHKYIVYRILRI